MSADEPEDGWNPRANRRRFIAAVGMAGAAGLSGCSGSGPGETTGDGGGAGGDGGNPFAAGPTTTGGDGADGGSGSDGTGGDGSDGDGEDTTTEGGDGDGDDGTPEPTSTPADVEADPESNPLIPPDTARFALPSAKADTTFDADLQEETVVIAGDDIDAIADADVENHRYTVEEGRLGRQIARDDVLLIPGVAMRTVTNVSRGGSRAVVETTQANLNEAIADGTVAWDAEVGWDAAFSPEDSVKSIGGGGLGAGVGGGGAGLGANGDQGEDADAYFAGVDVIGTDGETTEFSLADMQSGGPSLEWTYTEADREYTFKVEVGQDQATITVQVTSPASGDANLAYTAKGTVGGMRQEAQADYSDGELNSFDMKQKDLGGELELSIAAAGSGYGSIDWTFPGLMFKYVVFAGPVPVTIGIETKIIGNIHVPAKGSAEASSKFSWGGEAGFRYDGTSVDAEAQLGSMQFDPDAADSAANIGNAVDIQFGVAFPRIDVSIFDQGIIPYVHSGCTIGSRLNWGPLCKESYVRFVVQAGYDFSILGVSLASDKATLYEDQKEAKGDSCE